MKHISKALCTIILIIAATANTFATDIDLVEVFNSNTLSVTLSEKDNLSEGTQSAEVKVLKDTTIDQAQKSINDDKKVTITLPETLNEGTTYSLLTLFGAEGSIDFTTGDSLSGTSIENENPLSMEEQSIESITIIDPNTIEITYTTEVLGGEFEFKLLSELAVNRVENGSNTDSRIAIHLQDEVEMQKDYILMFLSLIDNDGEEVDFENSIFDFESPEYIEGPSFESENQLSDTEQDNEDEIGQSIQEKIAARNAKKASQEQDELFLEDSEDEIEQSIQDKIAARNAQNTTQEEESQSEEIVGELFGTIADIESQVEADVELTAAPQQEYQDTVTTALSATTTPNTGAETWVLILLTLVINTFYYCSRRKVA